MEEQKFEALLQEKTAEIEKILTRYLPREEGYAKTAAQAMNYSLMAGGKRLRPLLMQETYGLFGGKEDSLIEPFMAAIEMIHTYSLVHDDLPAMDNDKYRRGRKTTWAVYGEGMGILAGDGLLNYAFETALKSIGDDWETEKKEALNPDRLLAVLRALKVIGKKAGIYGMIGGQTADIEAEEIKEPLSREHLMFIHENKTAALIQASMMTGAILAGASRKQVQAVEQCAWNIGIAFQIQDDILDVTGDSRELGKMAGSDAQNNKQTYVTVWGLERASADVEKLSGEAADILEKLPGDHEFLEQLIRYLIHRRK